MGDPRAAATAGLAELDAALSAEFGDAPWAVRWSQTRPDGSLAPLTGHASLSEIGARAQLESGEFFARSAGVLETYLDNLAQLLATQPTQVDLVVLLLEVGSFVAEVSVVLSALTFTFADISVTAAAEGLLVVVLPLYSGLCDTVAVCLPQISQIILLP